MFLRLWALCCVLAWGLRTVPFYGKNEGSFREKVFEARVKEAPTGFFTPAWQALTATAPPNSAFVVYDSTGANKRASANRAAIIRLYDDRFLKDVHTTATPHLTNATTSTSTVGVKRSASRAKLKASLRRRRQNWAIEDPGRNESALDEAETALDEAETALDEAETAAGDEETALIKARKDLAVQVAEWQGTWRRLESELERRLRREGLLSRSTQLQTEKISLAVPASAKSLWKFYPFLLSVRGSSLLPRDMAIAVSPPSTYTEHVAYRAFLQLLPEIARKLPARVPLTVVAHTHAAYRQWGNRWLAANHTHPHSTWVSFFDNDDFMSAQRLHWLDRIVSTRPEVDVLLLGKSRPRTASYSQMIHTLVRSAKDQRPPPSKETAALSELLKTPTERLYNEPMSTMNATWLAQWRVGSVVGAPLYVGRKHFMPQLYNATREALNRTGPHRLTQAQRRDVERELEFLEQVDARANGTSWGDVYVQDGWPTIRRAVLSVIPPPTIAAWGEDSLYNWMIAASGFNYLHAVPPFPHFWGGTYLLWPPQPQVWNATRSHTHEVTHPGGVTQAAQAAATQLKKGFTPSTHPGPLFVHG
eukprot:Gregarina_sp_Pseudo_9__5945@NODE_95_length_4323_cov_28_595938_g87_i0_p1_GENE_NODE_95_length_4323_cov_28_595938_g87_i0NODE_95_length_4323_cov_28_595938_g87_i0_p1_ORF_typecomplete_len590_score153_66YscO/PF07321_12/0_015YscO/PF07321_12/4_2e03YscO/PF07321_12/1_1e04TENA_THI4/PF03070_16/1_2e03TENA_THI4/PF03070_16/0_058Phage_GP20/PF06810_11/0_11DUF2564/PF10819_8/0_19DUF2564/PF10819_8/1e04Glyco_tranf_2_4/PF13704_6/9_7e03Glyco_tranf_2_4/PF13704_6/0_72_NODE_95_length_4323_cov_28_595938_g87_i01651934